MIVYRQAEETAGHVALMPGGSQMRQQAALLAADPGAQDRRAGSDTMKM